MEECFQREGIDKLLKDRKIDFLFISHEHFDHFFGIEAVLKYYPSIPILIPSTFSENAIKLIKGGKFY